MIGEADELSATLEAVKKLVAAGQVRISEHGYDEIATDGIYVRDILAGVDKYQEKGPKMSKRHSIKYVHEGKYMAEVDVNLLEDETEWSPYLSVEDASKLDDVRDALRRGDIAAAAKLARVFALQPVAASQ